ncbi:NAD(P)H-hydrate dehydratase [Vibrio fortis]|uniref:NAD(P)H-hydrate dehydratase n=1 Tax=Vibrio fortis TaxID=212667 RepID=UPI003EB82248
MFTSLATSELPKELYLSDTIRQGEKRVAKLLGIPMYELMERAGESVFSVIQQRYEHCRRILVVTGTGNNGGDGYVVARLALMSGYKVTLWQVGSSQKISGDAKSAEQLFLSAGGKVQEPNFEVDDSIDLIVDGILGTGLTGKLRESAESVITTLNKSSCPVISIDVPSGLNSDTGRQLGTTVKANATVTFIALKRGLVTAQARSHVGELLFAGLSIDRAFADHNAPNALLTSSRWLDRLKVRAQDSHKGSHGRLLVVGGGDGMSGAAYLAAAASLRSGTGLLASIVHQSSCFPMRSLLPEAMVSDVEQLSERLEWCTSICVGVGLSRLDWGKNAYEAVMSRAYDMPKVIDADGLYWLAQDDLDARPIENTVITPHPGEAAMLLNCSVKDVEADRYLSIKKLCQKYRCVTVLKGAGTLISDGHKTVVCHAGNAGMATGGMGDVLAGVISSLLAQGYQPIDAAILGSVIHSMAADHNANTYGQVGMMASDVLGSIRHIINRLDD